MVGEGLDTDVRGVTLPGEEGLPLSWPRNVSAGATTLLKRILIPPKGG